MEKADSLLAPILKNLGIQEGVSLALIRRDWQNIFDETISSHMSPSKLFEGELLLNVDSPIWLQQLSYCKSELVKKLTAYGVKEVRFRLGRISQKKQHESQVQRVAELSSEDIYFIEDIVSKIDNESIKESAKRAMEKSILSKKHPG